MHGAFLTFSIPIQYRARARARQTKVLALRILGSVYQLLNDSQAENMLLMSYGTAKKLGSESLCLHVSKKLLGPSRPH